MIADPKQTIMFTEQDRNQHEHYSAVANTEDTHHRRVTGENGGVRPTSRARSATLVTGEKVPRWQREETNK